jgi:hypothetical protein
MVVGLVVGGAVACGGDSKTRTIKVAVQPGETANDWFYRALEQGQQACTGSKPPERVVFAFEDEDEKTEVAAAVEKEKMPTSANCKDFVQQTTGSANS